MSIITLDTDNYQKGFVALFSVMVIMAILGLLTIGFSSITRQAQKRTLDDHLSSQAFYAAESGINMAIGKLEANPDLGPKQSCGPDSLDNYTIDSVNNIAVSCMLIDNTVTNISNGSVTNKPVIDYFEAVSSTEIIEGINKVTVQWDSVQGISDPVNNFLASSLTTEDAWGRGVGMLKVELIPADIYDRAGIINNSYSFYLYPTTHSSGMINEHVDPGPNGAGEVIPVLCAGTIFETDQYRCSIDITPASANGTKFYVKQTSYYNEVSTSLSFVGRNSGSSSIATTLRDSQAIIDVTGRANDVYRRIQVRVPLSRDTVSESQINVQESVVNPYAIYSGDRICKRYSLGSTATDQCGP